MVAKRCSVTTDRLIIRDWRAVPPFDRDEQALATMVASMLTAPVTRPLPPSWHGEYTQARAHQWISEREGDGPVLLARERSTAAPIGLLILHESVADKDTRVDIRLGYLLAETAWGRGLGSELVDAFVDWCRHQIDIRSLLAGVAADNPASIRILEKNGFRSIATGADEAPAELLYELRLMR